MPFANGTFTLYVPAAANAGASQWGSDVRRLLSTADATADASTVCNLGTGGTVTRTADPYSTTAADLAQADYGFAIAPDDMGSLAGRQRFFPPGDHVATLHMTPSVPFTTEARDWAMYAYRVGAAPGRARSLLGSVSGQMAVAEADNSLVLPLEEIVFDEDETIQYSWEISAGGLAIVGRTVAFGFGTVGANEARISTPPLRTLAQAAGSSAGASTAAAAAAQVKPAIGAVAGLSLAAATSGKTAGSRGGVAANANAQGASASVKGSSGAVAGTAAATGALALVKGAAGTVNVSEGGETVVRRKQILIVDEG